MSRGKETAVVFAGVLIVAAAVGFIVELVSKGSL